MTAKNSKSCVGTYEWDTGYKNPIVYMMLQFYSVINSTWVNPYQLIQDPVHETHIGPEGHDIFYICSICNPYELRTIREFVFFMTIIIEV